MEIRNYAASAQSTSQPTVPSKELSVNDFLQIMAAEMKNQSPFGGGESGGSKTDYLTQMAQFTMLEQMGEISESLNVLSLMNQQQYTIGLIGKEVTVMDQEEGEITGVVEKVKFQNGYAVIQVNDKSYNLGAIVDITNVEEPEPEPMMCCNPECMDIGFEDLGDEDMDQVYPGYEDVGEDPVNPEVSE